MHANCLIELVPLTPQGIPLQSGDNPLIGIAFLSIFGLVSIHVGWQKYQKRRLIQDTPTENVRSMAAGRTELEGRARPREEPFEEPFGNGEAVIATYRIEEREKTSEDNYEWRTKESGNLFDRFLLDDGTGQALIDPTDGVDLDVSDENTTRYKVGKTEEEPDVIKEFLRTESDMGVPDSGLSGVVFGEKRRYTQEVIPPGEEVYVFGAADQREDASGSNAERLVLGEDEASDEFIVSDKTEDDLAGSLGLTALGIIALGVVFLTGAFYLVVTELGIAG